MVDEFRQVCLTRSNSFILYASFEFPHDFLTENCIASGEMAEWFNATVLKTVVPQGTLSSNLSLSAIVHNQPIQSVLGVGFFYTADSSCKKTCISGHFFT